jgi:hypothetical protein
MSSLLPKLVLDLTAAHGGWIVGSAADPEVTNPRDYDVAVPFSEWQKACMLIPVDAKRNHFGGWKCMSEGKEVDVWPAELSHLMLSSMNNWLWQPFFNIRYKKHDK